MVSIVAEVARNYINYRTAQEPIAYAKRNITIQERVTKITEVQFNSGNVSELDMQQARAQLYATRSALPSLKLNMIKARNAIAVLMGSDITTVDRLLQLHTGYDNVGKYINTKKSFIQIKEGDRDNINVSLVPTAKFSPHHKIRCRTLKSTS